MEEINRKCTELRYKYNAEINPMLFLTEPYYPDGRQGLNANNIQITGDPYPSSTSKVLLYTLWVCAVMKMTLSNSMNGSTISSILQQSRCFLYTLQMKNICLKLKIISFTLAKILLLDIFIYLTCNILIDNPDFTMPHNT